MSHSIRINFNGKQLLCACIVLLEILIGLYTSLNLKYSVLAVSALIVGVGSILLEPRLVLCLAFFTIPFSFFGIELGHQKTIHIIHLIIPALAIGLLMRIVIFKKFDFQRSPLDIPIILFLFYATMSFVWAPERLPAFITLAKILFSVAIYFLIVNLIKSRQDLYLCLWAHFFAMFILIVVVYLQISGWDAIGSIGRMETGMRFGSLTDSPSIFSLYLVQSFWLFSALALIENSRIKQNLIYFCIPFIFVALYYTVSRTAFVAISVSLVVYIIIEIKLRKMYFYILLSPILILILFLAYYLLRGYDFGFISSAFNPKDLSMLFRYIIWETSYDMFIDNFFWGVGIGGYSFNFGQYYTNIISIKDLFPGHSPIAHSLYLGIMTELGIFGFLLFLVIVWLALKVIIMTVYHFKETSDAKLTKLIIMPFFIILIFGITGFEKDEYEIWTSLGLAMAVCSFISKKDRNNGAAGLDSLNSSTCS